MLKTETNTIEMERRVMGAASLSLLNGNHHRISVDFEHGQWWATCLDCGAQYSVCDAEGPRTINGFCFEQVTEGDESCNH